MLDDFLDGLAIHRLQLSYNSIREVEFGRSVKQVPYHSLNVLMQYFGNPLPTNLFISYAALRNQHILQINCILIDQILPAAGN